MNVNANWMARLTDDTPIVRLLIPGSHDSCANRGGPLVKTQSLSLISQLESGVRAFDIRLKLINNALLVFHGEVFLHADFLLVVKIFRKFLLANQTEFLLVRIKSEGVNLSPLKIYAHVVETVHRELKVMVKIPESVGSARGKVLCLYDFPFGKNEQVLGVKWSECKVQDDFFIASCFEHSLRAKMRSVVRHLKEASASKNGSLYVNFLSATGGCAPHHVARVLNKSVEAHSGAGVLMCDFVNVGFLDALISVNFKAH